MKNESDFFINVFKARVKLFSETLEVENETSNSELEHKENDSEWKQEYELIYQSYSVD